MAVITNYATLQTAIADYLARDDLTSFLPNFVQNVENKLRRALNLRNEETALSISVSSGTGTVPSDFKALKFAYVDQAPVQVLDWTPLDDLYRRHSVRSGAEIPRLISREGADFVFGPFPKDFTLKGIYYAKQDPLRTTDPSWYVTNAPELLLYGALLESAPFIHDDVRLQTWRTLFNEAMDTVLTEESNAATSKGRLQQRPG